VTIKDFLRSQLRRLGIEIKRTGIHTPSLIQFLEPTLVLDVGANTGQFGRSIRGNGYSNQIL